jgi:hypothetical protein
VICQPSRSDADAYTQACERAPCGATEASGKASIQAGDESDDVVCITLAGRRHLP